MASHLVGLLRIKVVKGFNLVAKDAGSHSDPFVTISMGSQKLKTRHVQNSCNPEWNDKLTLAIYDVETPINLTVYDKDTFSSDDEMGEARIDIKPYVECVRTGYNDHPDDTVVHKILPNEENCLADVSNVIFKDGKLVQHMILTLKKAPTGKVEIEIEWVNVSGGRKI